MGKDTAPKAQMGGAPWQQGQTGDATMDFYGAAGQMGADSQANTAQQTQQNRPNQTNAFGASSMWGVGPDGRPTQTSSFGGGLGQYASGLESQLGSRGSLEDYLPAQQSGDQARDQAITGAYGQSTSRLDPQWAQREQQERSQLAAQGLDPSSQAYQTEMGNFGRDRNDAYSSAMNGAIGQGTSAGNSIFQNSLASRQQGMQEYNSPMQQLQGLQGLGAQQGFSQAGMAQIAPWLQAIMGMGNYSLGQTGQSNKNAADVAGGAGQLAGAGSGILSTILCDERAKTKVVRFTREVEDGVPLATWEYRHEPGVRYAGVIAQDLQKVRPDLVRPRADGMLTVPAAYAPRRLP